MMTRYYFDVCQDGDWHRDKFGVELVDFDEVKDQAIALLPDLARDALWSGDHHMILCRVRDDADVVYEGELTFDGRQIVEKS